MKSRVKVKINNLSYLLKVFILIIIILFIIVFIRVKIIDEKIKRYPVWIDKTLTPILEKKANVPIIYKMCEVLYFKGRYLDWSNVESYLDTLIGKIKDTNIKYDTIIGIKSGGAILTPYIANKMNIPYYYVKLSDKEYNCKKKTSDVFKDIYKNEIKKSKKEYTLCEPIKSDLTYKNVLVFDETISTGNTMIHTLNYLLYEKKVNKVLPITIFSKNVTYDGYTPLYIKNERCNVIWPWGYDN
jgi:hypoxanthine phosphoribosyltransferase